MATTIIPAPFHESIVTAIRGVASFEGLDVLGHLIRRTLIPENHDAILVAWAGRQRTMYLSSSADVVVHIEAEKCRVAEKKRVPDSMLNILDDALAKIDAQRQMSY